MALPPLYLIADPNLYKKGVTLDLHSFFEGLREAISGGLKFVQYRDKSRARGEMFQIAKQIREITNTGGAHLIINDEIDLALAVKADGVHLGQDDFPVKMARQLLGKTAVIGLSTHNLAQACEAATQTIDYIGFGPIFSTTTKKDHDPTVGISKIVAIRKQISLPIYAIGGIQFPALQNIINAGASGVAVASALKDATRDTISLWQETLKNALKKRGI
ncbi:MAG: thiamine phosphate synthase [Nitrospirae bacterium]|nr:thiamine phosphate synthase [Candidatus Manganitrophaceae bacterium]